MTASIYTVFPQDALDDRIARCMATPAGAELLDWMEQGWLVLTAPVIREAIERARQRWSTGGPVRTL